MTRRVLRAGGALVVALLLLGPSAQVGSSAATVHQRPAIGHTTDEWLMMGRNCGASQTAM